MSRIRKTLLSLALLVATAFAMAAPASAMAATAGPAPVVPSAAGAVVPLAVGDVVPLAVGDVNDFTFDSVDIEYELVTGADGAGHLRVVETYVANFTNPNTHRGMRRILPTSFNGAPLNPHLVSITDENGNSRPQTTDTEDGSYLMTSRASDPVIGRQTYVFTYTVDNVARYFSDADVDEFYWDVVGAEWQQPFGEVTMTLHLDDALAAALTGNMSCYVGYTSSTTPCGIEASADGREITVAVSDLRATQGVTIAVGFDAGTFTPFDGSYLAQGLAPVQLGVAGLGVAGLVGAIAVRRTAMRDAPGHPVVVAQYEPPAGVDAMNAAVMLGRSTYAATAEILEQAVRGTIMIRENAHKRAEYELVLVNPELVGDANGKRLIDILFGEGAPAGVVTQMKNNSRLANEFPMLVRETTAAQLAGGVRSTPSGLWRVVMPMVLLAIGALALIVGILITVATDNPMGGVIGGGALALSVVSMGLLMKRPFTAFGANLRDHLLGLKEFMQWAEADRIRMLQSPQGAERVAIAPGGAINVNDPSVMLRLYEPLLPFAVVFGIERQWTKTLQSYYEAGSFAPTWYMGSSAFSASSLGSIVGSFTAASSASSSSSGSGGGGSVGGGGGGGGGGGV